ncbi:uncharacterized protein [Drosophila bipectinata]|uniref:uncharacterized protein isoform X1 n=1 Tax=Drosophila bipectinata TaxID=42026 RepID=UPI001C8A07E0|nr:uncharacterized protein LOC108129742 isoform X1 [Drosophila bipectinata]XP_017103453.2 uncharacterized protein LOC108129742 isoform X1 [Drosophila bipectinata]
MDARNTPANKPLDGTKFLEMLSTISLEEVLKYEFRRTQAKKWDLLVEVCKDASTKKYQCNVCNVVQFGDKNLFSHLTGKKHNALLTSIMDLQIRKRGAPPPQRGRPADKPAGNSNSNNNNASNSNNSNNLNSRNSNSNNNANSNSKPNNSNSNKPNISNSNSNNSNQNKPVQRNVSPQKKPTPNSGANKKAEEPKPSTAEKPSGNGPPSRGVPNTNSSAKSQPQRKPGQNDKPAPRDNSAKNKNNVPNIVKNPLSNKISIVPLAKLISSNPEPEEDDNDMPMDVIVIDEDPPSENANHSIPIQTGLRQPAQEVDKNSQKRSAPPSSRPAVGKQINPSVSENSTARPDGLTFESSNVTEILGLVGVEYVLKIVRSVNARNARYLCCLCDITADEQRMQNHLVGYNHRLKYFDKHFPTAMRQYRQYVANVPESDVAKIMMPIFEKLAMAIEKHHGRESPYMCYEYYFGKDRNSLTTKVFSRRHASELLGPSFTHVVDAKEVEQMIEKMRQSKQQPQPLMGMEPSNPYGQPYAQQARPNNYANYNPEGPANNPPQSQTVDDETHKRMVDRFLRGNRPSRGDNHGSRNPKRNRSRSPSNEQRKRTVANPTKRLWNVERRSLSPLRDGDIWQAYRHMVDQKVRDLNVSFDAYKADPEQHPNYQQEWQRFWKRRKDELIQAGINHRSYNFQNEWIHYFNARLDELYNLEIEDIKLKCRERLCLPLTNHELENEKYHVHVRGVEEPQLRQPEPRQPEPRQQAPHQLAPRQLEPRQLEPRQMAPRQLEPRQPEQGHPDPSKKIRSSPPKEVEPPNVIHVLRLLTALENYLGSLGPFVTEMLAKALQTQRLYPDRVHNVILTSENCAILETAKEKFTGLLISQIYDPTKEKALKRAVHDTEMLLEEATKFVAPKDPDSIKIAPQVMEKPQGFGFDNKNKNPNQMQLLDQNSKKPFDKTELAAKLASSLVSQGKTSINREELQKILQVYNLIEQKKRQDDPPNSSDSPDRPIRSRNSPFDSEANDNPLSQHSTRNLNTNNETSNFTGQNYSENVARLNNKNSNMANSDKNYTSDRGFGSGSRQNSGSGGYQNTQYPSCSGTLQSSQYGSGLGSLQGNQYGARSGGLRNSEYGSGSGPAGLQQNLFGSGGGGLSSNQFGLGSGGLNNNPYGSGSSGGRYSSTQPGTGGSSLSSSSVLPNNLQMSSLFNFNTNLNPTYNSNRRSHNY